MNKTNHGTRTNHNHTDHDENKKTNHGIGSDNHNMQMVKN